MHIQALRRGVLTKGFPGPAAPLRGRGEQVFRGCDAQVGSLWKVLAKPAIGVLVRPALPGAVRVEEMHRDVGFDCEPSVLGRVDWAWNSAQVGVLARLVEDDLDATGSPVRRPVVVMSIVRSSKVEEESIASFWRASCLIGRCARHRRRPTSICPERSSGQ